MHARVTFLEFQPEDIEASARLFQEAVSAIHEQETGFQGAFLLVRDDGTAMAINFADTLDNLRENDRKGVYQSEVANFRSLIVGHPRREFFRIAASIVPESED